MRPAWPSRSPIQLLQRSDDSLVVAGAEAVTVESFLDPELSAGLPVDRESAEASPTVAIDYAHLFKQLGLPEDPGALDALAHPRGLSEKRVRAVLADESDPVIPGMRRLQPLDWCFATVGQLLTLEHSSYVIGICQKIWPGHPDAVPRASGHFLLMEARLYDSPLADRVWLALIGGLFRGVCAVRLNNEVIEVALTARPACPGAVLLAYWEEIPIRHPMLSKAVP